MRNRFDEHLNKHSQYIPVFTDGSKSVEGVGLAVIFPDSHEKRHLPSETRIYSAELYAILIALQRIYTMTDLAFVIVWDSRSALTVMEAFNAHHPLVLEIQEWLFLLSMKQKNIQFCWVPSHVGV